MPAPIVTVSRSVSAAAFLGERVSLLPPTPAPEVVRQIRAMTPAAVCLTDQRRCSIDLPQVAFPARPSARASIWRVPLIPAQRVVADIYTSGSTGLPVPHRKRWGPLMQCLQVAAARLEFDRNHPMTIVATVPPQHMYGFENSVLLSLCKWPCILRRASFLSGRHRQRTGARACAAHLVLHARAFARAAGEQSDAAGAACDRIGHRAARCGTRPSGGAALSRTGRGDLRLDRDRADRRPAIRRARRSGSCTRAWSCRMTVSACGPREGTWRHRWRSEIRLK